MDVYVDSVEGPKLLCTCTCTTKRRRLDQSTVTSLLKIGDDWYKMEFNQVTQCLLVMLFDVVFLQITLHGMGAGKGYKVRTVRCFPTHQKHNHYIYTQPY